MERMEGSLSPQKGCGVNLSSHPRKRKDITVLLSPRGGSGGDLCLFLGTQECLWERKKGRNSVHRQYKRGPEARRQMRDTESNMEIEENQNLGDSTDFVKVGPEREFNCNPFGSECFAHIWRRVLIAHWPSCALWSKWINLAWVRTIQAEWDTPCGLYVLGKSWDGVSLEGLPPWGIPDNQPVFLGEEK